VSASSSEAERWHYLLLRGVPAVSLYANPGHRRSEATLQWILPGFISTWRTYSEGFTMKGMWSNDKSENAVYREALDALNAVPEGLLASVLLAVVESGCALMFSATRDKGALVLTLLNGDARNRVYPVNVAELVAALTDLRDSLTDPAPSPAPKRRPAR
jgi:hypothetical protein